MALLQKFLRKQFSDKCRSEGLEYIIDPKCMFVMFVNGYKIVCRFCQLTITQLTISTQGLPTEMEILTAHCKNKLVVLTTETS